MKTISKTKIGKTALVALMTATIGFSAIAPTFAQEAAAPAPAAQGQNDTRQHNQGPRNGGPMGGGDFLGIERGVEAIEIAFVRLSHNLELTTEQQPLFDAFKTASISAATKFATATDGLRPTPPVEGETPVAPVAPDLAKRLDDSITIQAARLAALEAVQPSATAFFASLTDEQKANLMPQRPEGAGGFGKGGHHGEHGGPRHGGPGMNGGPGAPEGAPAPMEAPAPADAPTPPPVNG